MLPEIDDIDLNKSFKAHNFKKKPLKLTNLNGEKISRLNEQQLKAINQVFETNQDLLKSFGYDLIKR